VVGFDRVPQRESLVDLVVGPTPVAPARDDASLFQLAQNTVNRPFGDSDREGDLAHPNVRIPGDTDQDVSVIAEKAPGRCDLDGAHGFPVFSYIKQKSGIDKNEINIMLLLS
jgi:hypothetical protein